MVQEWGGAERETGTEQEAAVGGRATTTTTQATTRARDRTASLSCWSVDELQVFTTPLGAAEVAGLHAAGGRCGSNAARGGALGGDSRGGGFGGEAASGGFGGETTRGHFGGGATREALRSEAVRESSESEAAWSTKRDAARLPSEELNAARPPSPDPRRPTSHGHTRRNDGEASRSSQHARQVHRRRLNLGDDDATSPTPEPTPKPTTFWDNAEFVYWEHMTLLGVVAGVTLFVSLCVLKCWARYKFVSFEAESKPRAPNGSVRRPTIAEIIKGPGASRGGGHAPRSPAHSSDRLVRPPTHSSDRLVRPPTRLTASFARPLV